MSETLPQLYRQTAETLERIARGESQQLQKRHLATSAWLDCSGVDREYPYFYRIKPETPEELRIERNLALKAEWEKERFPVQFRWHWEKSDRLWEEVANPGWSPEADYRRKPAPKYVPFTFADDICGKVAMRSDAYVIRGVIIEQTSAGVRIMNASPDYATFLKYWTIDGKPAGKLEGGE